MLPAMRPLLTFDDSSDTDGGLEGASSRSRVELLALLFRLVWCAQPAGVFHGDLVTRLWRRATALGDDGLGDTHCASCGGEGSSCDARSLEKASHRGELGLWRSCLK